MLEKFIIIYTFITTLSPANKLSTWAVSNGHFNKGVEATELNLMMTNNMETWQPIAQTRNWLVAPTTASATTTSTLTSLTTSTPSLQNSNLRIKLSGKTFSQQHQHLIHNQLKNNYLAYSHHSGNYSKSHQTTISSTTLSMPSNLTHIKLKPYLLHKQQQLPSYQQHYNHYPLKHIVENVYPKIPIIQGQKPHTNHRVSNLKLYLASDVNQREQHPNSVKSTPTFDNINILNPTVSIASTNPFNMFEINKNLIDSKSKISKTLNIRRSDNDNDDIENNVENLNEKMLRLQNIFDNVKEFYESLKDFILSDVSNVDDFYSSDDEIEYGLPMLNFKPKDVVIAKTSTAAATLTEEKLLVTNKQHIKLSSGLSIGEVQGHNIQVNKGNMIHSSLIPSLAVSSSSSSSVLTTRHNDVQNVSDRAATQAEITARGLVGHESSTSPLSSSSLETVGTGRKVKKLKKKFQKFLLPLVLAYKLKFLTLIPLLIGGLTLLVGTTGLAGFFFALFAAVMTLKSGSRNAIVVKKY